jgi:hypothetical protein
MAAEFNLGRYRPISLWAGPGTVWMNRLRFMTNLWMWRHTMKLTQ